MSTKYKILVCPANEGGCAFYRAINPYEKLQEILPDRVEVKFDFNPLGLDLKTGQLPPDFPHDSLKWADIVVVNNICNFGGNYTARVLGMAKEFGKIVHYDTDDLLTNLYSGHRLESVYKDKGLSDVTKWVYNNADLVTVTQVKFAKRIQPYVRGMLAVVKNAIDYDLPAWTHDKAPPPNKKICRVGWAGGIHHEEDVKEFAGVPHRVNQRVGKERVHWGFYGRPPGERTGDEGNDWQFDVWDNYRKILTRGFKGAKNWQVYPAMNADAYGIMFAHMDIAIAPLQMNEFNDSKSDIKVAEAGRYRVPLVASDVGCYNETITNWETGVLIPPDAPKSEWVRVLSKLVRDKKLRERMGNNLHEITEDLFDLNKVVSDRVEMYDALMVTQKNALLTNLRERIES